MLLREVIEGLAAAPGKHFVDATVGDGGHTRALLAATAPDGRVLGIDADATAIAHLQEAQRTDPTLQRLSVVHGNFKNIAAIVRAQGFHPTGGVLLDLGFSSRQVDAAERGFGFHAATLDLRYDPTAGDRTAADLLREDAEATLADIFHRFGEEPLARPIARAIVQHRRRQPITSGQQLTGLVTVVYRRTFRRPSRRQPATRVFQALRIAVNGELENLSAALLGALDVLPSGSRLAVISYHSLEDRIVKQFFRQESRGCRCPVEAPCTCGAHPRLSPITRKPIRPGVAELSRNRRARSAKLRVAQRRDVRATTETEIQT